MRLIPKSINYLSISADEQAGLAAGAWYSSTYSAVANLANINQLGTMWFLTGPTGDGGGNAFMCVKATEDLSAGSVVAVSAPATGTYTAAGSTVAVLNTNFTTASANSNVGDFLWLGTINVLKLIKANTSGANANFTVSQIDYTIATNPFDPDALTAAQLAALSNSDAISIIPSWKVRKVTNALTPVAVSIGAVTAATAPYCIVQVKGIALTLATNAGAALVYDVPAIISATSGVITGGTATVQAGRSLLPLAAYNAAGPTLQPVSVNFLD